jgi:hypothetical protein
MSATRGHIGIERQKKARFHNIPWIVAITIIRKLHHSQSELADG